MLIPLTAPKKIYLYVLFDDLALTINELNRETGRKESFENKLGNHMYGTRYRRRERLLEYQEEKDLCVMNIKKWINKMDLDVTWWKYKKLNRLLNFYWQINKFTISCDHHMLRAKIHLIQRTLWSKQYSRKTCGLWLSGEEIRNTFREKINYQQGEMKKLSENEDPV